MIRIFRYLILTILPLLIASCGSNEFTIEGTLTGGDGQTITLVHRAASKKQDFIIEQTIPVELNGRFTVKLNTRYPTVVWVLTTADGSLLMPIYAEHGDELKLTGKFAEPQLWKVEGNKVMEQYSEWAAANINALMSDNAANLNAAIGKYVKQNPDSRTAAFLLFTRFVVPGYEDEYQQLVKTLKLDEDDLKEMQNACMTPQNATRSEGKLPQKLTLPDMNDTLCDVSLKGSGNTLLYFWRDETTPEARDVLVRANSSTDAQTVSIFMDTDTVRWHRQLQGDSTLNRTTRLWTPSGEMTPSLQPFAVSGTPYFIIIDNSGTATYRGSDAKAAASKL